MYFEENLELLASGVYVSRAFGDSLKILSSFSFLEEFSHLSFRSSKKV